MRKFSFLILFLIIIMMDVFATHNRAGEITYRQISDLTFEITIITYTATGPGWTADRPELEIQWGDNTTSILPRVEKINLPHDFRRNKYIGTHTYPGPGVYVIVVEDPNRNLGVNNIPNSVNTIFSISTTMLINPTLGINNTPILTQPPVDKAAVGQIFTHNPGAYDPDGDSLSYKLTICRAENGNPIEGYTFPAASNSLTVNEITGDLVWDAPVYPGVYNIAMLIEEWRKEIKIGQIIRDMQIEVFNTNNKPPIINATDICIEADSLLTFTITATDPNNDSIRLSAHGAPFEIPGSAASLNQIVSEPGYAKAEFTWQTECDYVRKQAYNLNIKAEDNNSTVSLVDIKSIGISIVGPKVENPIISATTNEISLVWDANYCTNVIGYNIYRRITPSGFEPDFCEVGVPADLGYTKIAFVEGYFNTSYNDNSASQGNEYCYLITAVFPDKAEGYASDEICAVLIRGIPTITNVSVNTTDDTNGEIYIAWSKPTEIDIGEAPGPYQYVLYRSEGYFGENLIEIATINNIDDTSFVDTNIDTRNLPWSYKVEFYNNQPGNKFLIGTPHIASSVYIDFKQMENALKLNFNKNTPWVNSEYTIYRYSDALVAFDSIGTTNANSYIDKGLINGTEYCYLVRSSGAYSVEGIINPIINFSQENCEEAIDTTPPCPPDMSVTSTCDSVYFEIAWNYNDTCYNDVKEYRLYYSPYIEGDHKLIHTINANSNSYIFYPELGMAGCFYMTAVDSFNNESSMSVRTCLDDCTYYELPNVFTPNNDGMHDLFQPFFPYYFVEKINIQIFNRWGQLMFETEDPDINWDGRNFKNGRIVSDGVYYYICDVYEQRLTGIEVRHLNGFVHVFNSIDTKSMQE
ncbi:MAG: gliding motility-associated C-terminal domain-containing protein [Bacteroidales bacterium]|nr:gliding motility-associated C-terminal domain-containing protein [Bacteroidales bacterium]MDD4215904.1 gliding motility-associated C-terminal domain-containing protein [Bacteroidales bacterium]